MELFQLSKEGFGWGALDLYDDTGVQIVNLFLPLKNFRNRLALCRAAYGGNLSVLLLVVGQGLEEFKRPGRTVDRTVLP